MGFICSWREWLIEPEQLGMQSMRCADAVVNLVDVDKGVQ